jgi:hypothetical protein
MTSKSIDGAANASRSTLTDGLVLSICPILAGWGDMSKEKPSRAISSKKLPG